MKTDSLNRVAKCIIPNTQTMNELAVPGSVKVPGHVCVKVKELVDIALHELEGSEFT